MWQPETLKDRLLAAYSEEEPGDLYLEVPVGGGDPSHGPRRIDGVLRIYGDQPGAFRQATWERYKSRLGAEADE